VTRRRWLDRTSPMRIGRILTLDAAMTERLGQPLQPGSETPQDKAARVLFDHRRIAVFPRRH